MMFYIWLSITLLAIIIEFITTDLISIWFVPSGIICIVLALVNINPIIQIVVFIVLSVVLILTLRKQLAKYLNKNTAKLNHDSIIGQKVKLISPVSYDNPGSAKINGLIWSVVSKNPQEDIPSDTYVLILEISGNKLIVEQIKD